MCGIAGIVDRRSPVEPELVPRMLAALRHRGPDGEGEARGEGFHIGMRRLAIIDCQSGDQPIYNEDRSIFVVLNGEIYNYLELRDELARRGHRFATQSDTEVLVHGFEEWGIAGLERLNGMFAFLVADLRSRTFHLVRDRLGIKPLYWTEASGRFVFSSELRSLLAGGVETGGLSPEALAAYFTYLCIPSPSSPFRRIQKLPAAHRLEVSREGTRLERWWRPEDFIRDRDVSLESAAEELAALLQDAVRLQLRSDVPVGTCLSGGIDSSLVTALAAELHPDPIDTFFAAIEPVEFDESPFARQVAERWGTRHHEVNVSAEEAIRELPRLAWSLDEPNADAASLPTLLVSRLAASRVKVGLSGLGGDELFGGYPRYGSRLGRIGRLARLPRPLVAAVVAPVLRAVGRSKELDWCLANPEPWQAYFRLLRQTPPELLSRLLPDRGLEAEVARPARDLFTRYPGGSEANRRMYVDAQLYMSDQLLQMTDRMSMACSLEMRVPLLDHRLVEWSLGLPARHKLNRVATKRVVRAAFGDRLPRGVFDRPKAGFGPPHERWVTSGAFRPLLEQAASGALAADGVVDRGALAALLGDLSTRKEHARFAWMLVTLELWYRALKESRPEAASSGAAA